MYLNNIQLGQVVLESLNRLKATVPANLEEGVYDLRIVNPGGPAVVLVAAVRVKAVQAIVEHLFLPVTFKMDGWSEAKPAKRQTADWPTLGYDPSHSGYNQVDPGGSRYALAWSAALPYPGGSPLQQVAVADGVLVASSDSYFGEAGVVALSAESGEELWRYAFNDKFSINPPSIAHSAVYFQQGNHSDDSYLFCLDLLNGRKNWQSTFYAQWEEYLAPLVVGSTVYVNAGADGGMAAYHAGDGRELWWQSMPQYNSWTPAYADGSLYAWVAGFFSAHEPGTGDVKWSLDLGWPWYGYDMETAAVVVDSTALVVNSEHLYAIDLVQRKARWSAPGDYRESLPAVADGVVYALKSGLLEARQLSDGTLL